MKSKYCVIIASMMGTAVDSEHDTVEAASDRYMQLKKENIVSDIIEIKEEDSGELNEEDYDNRLPS